MRANSPGPRAYGRQRERPRGAPRRQLTLVALCLALAVAASISPAAAPQQAPAPGAAPRGGNQATRETLDRYCVTCHNQRVRSGELALDALDVADVRAHAATWEKVVRKVRTGSMPPAGMPRPDTASAAALVSALTTALDDAATSNPGRPLLHRLNRAEYANVVRDLLAIDVDVRSLLPADDSAFGFDNNADLLVVSPSLLDRYLTAADRVSALAVGDMTTAPGSDAFYTKGDQSQSQQLDGLPFGTVGGIGVRYTFPLDGEYEFRVALTRTNLEAIRGLEHPHQLEISVDGARVFLMDIGGAAEAGQTGTITDRSDATDSRLHVRVPVKAGPRLVAATFIRKIAENTNRLRPFLRSNAGTYDSTGRPHVKSLTIKGPFNPTGPGDTPSRQRVFVCRPATAGAEEPPASAKAAARSRRSSQDIIASEDGCARRILTTLARRAYRRPVTDQDIAPLMAFYRDGRQKGSFDTGVQLALRRLLASPTFIFRVEEDPANVAAGRAYRVSDVELASRLSFFLWSSMPDDTLLDLAAAGRLRQPAVLAAQVRRMLADPKAGALTENFAGQWLHIRNLQNIAPNTDEFPDFDNDLRDAFRRETELFFGSVVREDRDVLDLMTADYTFVNERLAKHYGLAGVYGPRFRRVTLAGEARRGLLGKGSILLATSHADRTAPTLRGKWILENLLGTPPPAPPANVPPFEQTVGAKPRTIRERLESHRANPSCASCHRTMDGLGFTLENFNAVGAWRDREAGADVNAEGTMTDGGAAVGVAGLRAALLKHPDVFVQTLTEKLMIYALGRGLQEYDMPVVRRVVRDAGAQQRTFSALVLGIVKSAPFQMRRKSES
jgi:mono/diheme cytochrome c family protein